MRGVRHGSTGLSYRLSRDHARPRRRPTVPGLTGLTVLARGGYATVYRAIQASVGRDVAVKVENRTLESDRDRSRFLREARAAGRMSSHPHVVDLFDAGVTDDGHPYLIMELCDGSYAERMRTRRSRAAEARDVGLKIADALADAHSLGVLHRDVKPANILFSRFGEPALADFGLAILAEWRESSITLDAHPGLRAAGDVPARPPAPRRRRVRAVRHAVRTDARPAAALARRPDAEPASSLVDMFAEPIPDLPGCPENLMAVLRRGMTNDGVGPPDRDRAPRPAHRPAARAAPPVIVPPLGSPPIEPVYTSKAPPTPPPPPDRILGSPFMVGEALEDDPDKTVQHGVEFPVEAPCAGR